MFDWVGFILIGFFVGLVARALKPGNDRMGIVMTSLLGISGSLVAGLVGRGAGWYGKEEGAGFIVSTIGAIAVLSLYYLITRRQPSSGKRY